MNDFSAFASQGTRPSATGRSAGGFTLVEMMVVMGIIGVILMATIPAFGRFVNSSRLAGATNMLVSDLHYARSLSNSQHTNFQLRRTTEGYSLVRASSGATVLSRTLPRGVTMATAGTTTFFSWGLTQPASITLQGSGQSHVVTLTAGGQVTRD